MVEQKKKPSILEDIFDWIETMAISILTIVLIFTFLFRIVQVDGPSMMQTLQNEDKLITTHLFYTPEHGDIIVCNSVGLQKIIVKRVIGLEGDVIDIDFKEGIVYRNGEALEEDYTNILTTRKYDIDFPITVEEGTVFVMGDNRDASNDSRSSEVGLVETEQILGKVVFRLFPFDTFGTVE